MTAAVFAQAPDQPAIIIRCKLTEVTSGGEHTVLSQPTLVTLPNRPATFRVGGSTAVAKRGRIVFIETGLRADFVASELRNCTYRLSGEVEYAWLVDGFESVEERRRVVRAPLPASVLQGRRTRLELKKETGTTLVFEFELDESQ
jgi:hypothetical protein